MKITEKVDPIYCVKCKVKTDNRDPERVAMKNGRGAITANCVDCGTRKYRIGGKPPTLQAPILASAYETV